MLEWAKAGYSASNMQPSAVVTTLSYSESRGRYHIYEMSNGQYVAVFDNQKSLLNFVNDNLGSIFMLGFLFTDNSIYSYPYTFTDSTQVTALTLARATVLAQGSPDMPRTLWYDSSDELVVIE